VSGPFSLSVCVLWEPGSDPASSRPYDPDPARVLCVLIAAFSVGLGTCRTPRTTISNPRPMLARPRPTHNRPAPSARTDTSSSSSAHARSGPLLPYPFLVRFRWLVAFCARDALSLEGNRLVLGDVYVPYLSCWMCCCSGYLLSGIVIVNLFARCF
jgi:hypothetical protein